MLAGATSMLRGEVAVMLAALLEASPGPIFCAAGAQTWCRPGGRSCWAPGAKGHMLPVM